MENGILGFLLISFLQVKGDFAPYTFTDDENACIQELNLNETTMYDLYGYGQTVEHNTDLNNFMHCVWQKLGFQNEDGVINYPKLKQSFDITIRAADDTPSVNSESELLSNAVNFCQNNILPKGSNSGEVATRTQNCIIENYEKLKFAEFE